LDYYYILVIFAFSLVCVFIIDKLIIIKKLESVFVNLMSDRLHLKISTAKMTILINVLIFLVSSGVLFIFNKHEFVVYNNYSYLSDALLHGRFDIPNMPLYLEQVAFEGKTYMHFAPGPSIILLPFIAIFGMSFDISIISILLGAANCVIFYNILIKLNINNFNTRIWLTILFGFGTVHFFLAALGHSWFLGHIVTTFFLLMAVLLTLNNTAKKPFLNLFLAGFCFAFAITCRLPVLLTFPFFILIILFHQKRGLKGLISFGVGAFIPGFLYMLYNYLRYNTIMDLGYYLTFEKDKKGEPGGPLQFKYIPFNLYSLFLMAPVWSVNHPYIYPSLNGLALTFTTPAAIFAFKAKSKWYLIVGLWISIIFAAIPFVMNYGNGMAQFGMRYSMDFLPFIIILAAIGLNNKDNTNLSNLKKALILFCAFVNGWGAIIWNMGLQKF